MVAAARIKDVVQFSYTVSCLGSEQLHHQLNNRARDIEFSCILLALVSELLIRNS